VLSSISTLKSEDNPQLRDHLPDSKSVGLGALLPRLRVAATTMPADLDEKDLRGLKRITQIVRRINIADLVKSYLDAGNFENNGDARRELWIRRSEMLTKFQAANLRLLEAERRRMADAIGGLREIV
jgi:hypothetical protein